MSEEKREGEGERGRREGERANEDLSYPCVTLLISLIVRGSGSVLTAQCTVPSHSHCITNEHH